jgi:uncharacterized Zn finger protein
VRALEDRARLDANRLPRGRTYLRQNRVGVLTAEAGEVRASVRGSRESAYRVRVRVRPFTDQEWELVVDAISAKAAHSAALLDGELSPAIVADVEAAGLDLLPGPGEIGTSCSCPDWANPCKHAAAVCYLVADLLDDDPFTLLLLRGRSRDQMLAALRSRRAATAGPASRAPSSLSGGDRGPDPGVAAAAAFAAARPPLPRPPLPPGRPARPAPLAVDAPTDASVTAAELHDLAADSAGRAWALATGDGDGGLGLTTVEDLARRADGAVGTAAFADLARRSGTPERDLMRLALAWRHGGAGAVAVLDGRWDPPPEVLDEARVALRNAGAARVRVDGNRVAGIGIQLRYGSDGHWYRFELRRGRWEVAASPPDADPHQLLTPAGADLDELAGQTGVA